MSVFDDSTRALADRTAIRNAAVQRMNLLKDAANKLESASRVQPAQVDTDPLPSQIDISQRLSAAEQLRGEIDSARSARKELERELAKAQAFRAKMIKYGAIGGGVILLLLFLMMMG